MLPFAIIWLIKNPHHFPAESRLNITFNDVTCVLKKGHFDESLNQQKTIFVNPSLIACVFDFDLFLFAKRPERVQKNFSESADHQIIPQENCGVFNGLLY